MPLLGAIAGVLATNFGGVHVGCTFLYIDNTKNWLVLSGVYASIIFRFFIKIGIWLGFPNALAQLGLLLFDALQFTGQMISSGLWQLRVERNPAWIWVG